LISLLRRLCDSEISASPPGGSDANKIMCLRVLIDSMSYVPLIAPSTSIDRVKFLTSIADTFIYVVSKVSSMFTSSPPRLTCRWE
jgi:tryptophan synthase